MLGFCARHLLALILIAMPGFANAAAPASGIEGSWSVERTDPGAAPGAATIAFTRNGNVIGGTMRSGSEDLPLFDVRDANGRVSFSVVIPGTPYVNVRYSGTRTDTAMTLASSDDGNGVYRLSAKRVGRPPASTRAAAPVPSKAVAEAAPRQPARAAPAPAPSPAATPSVQAAPGPGVPSYIARLLGQPAVGGGAPAAVPLPTPPPPQTRTASAQPPPARPTPPPKPAAPASAPPRNGQPATPPPAQRAASIEGEWAAQQTPPGAATPTEATLTFRRSEGALTGTMRQGADELPLFEVRQAGVSVSFMLVIPGTPYVSVRYAGRIAGDALDVASIDEDGGKYTLTARRVARSNPVSAPVAEATPPAIETSPSAPAEPVPERQTALLTPEARSSPPEPAITEPPMPEAAPPLATEPKIATLEPPAPVAEAPPPPPVLRGTNPLGAPAKPAGPATLKGRWTAEQKGPGSAAPVEAALSFDGSSGSMRVGEDDWPLFDVKQTGSDVGFTLVIPGTPYITIHYRGMLMGDAFTVASIDEGQMGFTIDARREGSDARPPAPRIASLNPPLPRPAPRRTASPAAPPPSDVPVAVPPSIPEIAPPSPPEPVPQIASVAPPVELPLRGTQPIAPSPPAPMPMPEAGPSLDLIPALHEPPPMPEVASAAPPPEPAPPPHERYTPPPLSTAPVAKLPLPSLRDVAPSMALKVPPMGWASRERLGTMIDDQAIRQAADGLEETGLKAVGFTYVEVDDGWQGERDESGTLHSNPEFPDMKALGDYIHGKGLKFVLMTSAAPQSCAGYTGSYGHEAEDAKTFASWGVDILVYDWCGAEKIYSSQPEMQAAYQKMGEALRASGRDIAFEIAGNGQFEVANWGSRTSANLWRTAEDLEDKFSSVMDAGFAVTGAPSRNGQRGWNDPGLLQTGNGGMTTDEYRAQINLWAVLGAPMMLGNDVRIMRRETVDLLSNKEVLAINQDALGRQGIRISPLGNTGVWAKPLSNGAVAVLFVNRSNASAPAAVSWEQLGIMGPMQVRDVWWHEDIGMANNRYAVFLTAHTSLLLILSPEP